MGGPVPADLGERLSTSNLLEKPTISVAVVAFTPDWGHVQPLLKIADALAGAGHRLRCYLPAESAPLLKRLAFDATFLDPMDLAEGKRRLATTFSRSIFHNRFTSYVTYNMYFAPDIFSKAGDSAERIRADLIAQQPDVILADAHLFADWYGRLGEELGVPVILNHQDGILAGEPPPFVRAYGYVDGVPQFVQRAIAAFGAAHARAYNIGYRLTHWRASQASRAAKRKAKVKFDGVFPRRAEPGRVRGPIRLGAALTEGSRPREASASHDERVFAPLRFRSPQVIPDDLREWLDASPETPIVYVSLGSAVVLSRRFVAALHEGLRRLPVRALWSLPAGQHPLVADLPRATNIRLETFVPQPEVLMHPNVRCFVTQGGPWSVQEAWFGGTPMVVTPFFADQPYNASIVRRMGLGVRLWRNKMTAASVRAAVAEVLGSASFADNAARLREQLSENDGARAIVEFIEGTVSAAGRKSARRPEGAPSP